jgi:hypothetical protein
VKCHSIILTSSVSKLSVMRRLSRPRTRCTQSVPLHLQDDMNGPVYDGANLRKELTIEIGALSEHTELTYCAASLGSIDSIRGTCFENASVSDSLYVAKIHSKPHVTMITGGRRFWRKKTRSPIITTYHACLGLIAVYKGEYQSRINVARKLNRNSSEDPTQTRS